MGPLIGLAVLIIGGAIVLAVLGLLITRRLVTMEIGEGHNDIAVGVYATIGVLYAIVLAFVVLVVWNQYSSAEDAVTNEAAAAVVAYRSTQEFPAPYRQQAQQALRRYIHLVTTTEWADHGMLLPHRTPDLLNPVWDVYRKVLRADPKDESLWLDAFTGLHDLELQRHLRHLSGEATLPDVVWWILVLGSVVTIVFTYFFHMSNLGMHAVMVGVLAASLASILFLILVLNRPFTGVVHVSTYPFEHALQQFHAIDLDQ